MSFTVHTHEGTGCELLLFHREEEEPYAVLPFPEEYRIGDVYSMIVFGLNIEEFEYAYRIDGPWEPEKGLRFDKNAILLDPYARAVTGQSVWGKTSGKELPCQGGKGYLRLGKHASVEKGAERACDLRASCERLYQTSLIRGFP